ncbi:MAG: hypothetical protein J6A17_00855 [Bacilli bacterium]|nr:hypothetical protein [Bacilli bacterium]MBO5414154.1 hypothetical protein [Bacilli bacterium]
MTYDEMKQKISELQLESLGNDIKVNELDNPRRFEAAGLGIIDMSQLNYYGPIGLYCIYSGEWHSPNKEIIKSIVPSTNVDVFGEYYLIVKSFMDKNKI